MLTPNQLITHRLSELRAIAHSRMIDTEAAKTTSAIVGLIGAIGCANPLFAVAGIIGGTMYACAIGLDYLQTRRFFPLPIYRQDFAGLLDSIGSQEFDNQSSVTDYLSPDEEFEWTILSHHPKLIADFLGKVPGHDRALAYHNFLQQSQNGKVASWGDEPTPKLKSAEPKPASIEPAKVEPAIEPDPWQESRSEHLTANSEHLPITPQPVYSPAPEYRLIDLLLDNPLLTRIIVAGQRTGKTYSAAVATWSIGRQHNINIKIYYLNLYDHGQGNQAAFDHCDRIVTGNLASANELQREKLLGDALRLINEFVAGTDGILVVDEWMSFGAKRPSKKDSDKAEWEISLDYIWARLFEQLSHFNSVGIASGKAIWAIAPYFQAGALRDEAKPIKNSEAIVLNICPGSIVEWQNPVSGNIAKIGYNEKITDDVGRNWGTTINPPTQTQSMEWSSQGYDRIYWHGGKWRPVGEMPAKPKKLEVAA